ncbi:hypothetical protein ScPMuIL_009608 [Solemya velum]
MPVVLFIASSEKRHPPARLHQCDLKCPHPIPRDIVGSRRYGSVEGVPVYTHMPRVIPSLIQRKKKTEKISERALGLPAPHIPSVSVREGAAGTPEVTPDPHETADKGIRVVGSVNSNTGSRARAQAKMGARPLSAAMWEVSEYIRGPPDQQTTTRRGSEVGGWIEFGPVNFEPDHDTQLASGSLTRSERVRFRSKVLGCLREQPLSMVEKKRVLRLEFGRWEARGLDARRLDHSASEGPHRQHTVVIWRLWEGSLKKLAAYFGSHVASYFTFLRILTYLNVCLVTVLFCFTALPQIVAGDITNENGTAGSFGELSNTIMFYGAYTDSTLGGYKLALAYFLTWFSANVLSFIIIVVSMQYRYRRSKLAADDIEYSFAGRLFCNWDYSVTSKEGVVDLVKAIQTDLKENIREAISVRQDGAWNRIALWLKRIVINILVLACLAGSGYLIYFVADLEIETEFTPDFLNVPLEKYRLSSVVAGLKIVVPFVFSLLVRLEGWHPRVEVKLTLARTTLFYFASLIVFVTSLYDATQQNITQNITESGIPRNETRCWENEVGEEVFKLVILDFGLTILVSLVFVVAPAIVIRLGSCKVEYSEFSVPTYVLDLIYGQGMVWLGIYFSPFLALVATVKLVVLFYFRYVTAIFANVPPRRLFRASRSGNFYLFLLLIMLFLCTFPVAYAVIVLKPSAVCGPFRDRDHVYEVFTGEIGSLPTWLEDVFNTIGTSAVIIPVMVLLVLVVLFYRAKAKSYRALNADLRDKITFERKVEKRKVFADALAMSRPTADVKGIPPVLHMKRNTPSAGAANIPDCVKDKSNTDKFKVERDGNDADKCVSVRRTSRASQTDI